MTDESRWPTILKRTSPRAIEPLTSSTSVVDRYLGMRDIDTSVGRPSDSPRITPKRVDRLDIRASDIQSVIWATGYDIDLPWIELPIFDSHGQPIQRRGITPAPGIYFLGLAWMHKVRVLISLWRRRGRRVSCRKNMRGTCGSRECGHYRGIECCRTSRSTGRLAGGVSRAPPVNLVLSGVKEERLKASLKPGIHYEHRFVVPVNKTVPALCPEAAEFLAMPEVFATGYLVGLLEWACIRAMTSH